MAGTEPFEQRSFSLFNKNRTVGVKSRHGGATAAIYLHPDTANMTERALAREIVDLAHLGTQRGLLSVREHLEHNAEHTNTPIDPSVWDLLDDVPTHAAYQQLKKDMT